MSITAILSSSPFALALLLFKLAALTALVAWAVVRFVDPRTARGPQPKG